MFSFSFFSPFPSFSHDPNKSCYLSLMAAKDSSHPVFRCPGSDDSSLAEEASKSFEGFKWRLEVTSATLQSLKAFYGLLDSVIPEVPGAHEGTVDSEGFSLKVALYPY